MRNYVVKAIQREERMIEGQLVRWILSSVDSSVNAETVTQAVHACREYFPSSKGWRFSVIPESGIDCPRDTAINAIARRG